MKFVFLSHPLGPHTIGYGGKTGFSLERVKSLCAGDSCNQSHWTLSNHIGTHLDAPLHFAEKGLAIDAPPADFWVFLQPQVVDIPAKRSEIIGPGSWCDSIKVTSDLLLLRTGFESLRDTDEYWAHNPGLSPALGRWLRENRPSVRMIGMDFLSLTSYDHRPLGKEAHQAFLAEGSGNPIWILEDMRLSTLSSPPRRVTVSPLRVEGADGSPVTVIGEL
jgi:arylformamidase